MPSLKVSVSFFSVQSIKPSQVFGSLAYVPIKSGAKEILIRGLVSTLPRGAVVTKAELHLTQRDAWSGSNTLSIRHNTQAWSSTTTWNTRPTVSTVVTDSVTKSGSAALTKWVLDVTDDVQGWRDGSIPNNRGWTLRTDNAVTAHYLLGNKASSGTPYLLIEYTTTALVPTDLAPHGGAVSMAKPVLTFQTSDNMVALQVQIDAAADAVSPDFDSGEVAATGGELDLATTAYAGLADGSTTFWRARAKGPGGWSGWSSWVSFSHEDLETVTLTAPAASTADTTPPFAWTFTGTQKAWQADILYGTTVLRSSGLQSGADNDWTAPRLEGNYFGKTLTARIRAWDDVTRIATPGVPTYSEDTVDYIAAFTATVDPMDSLTATQSGPNSPGIVLAGTRAAGIPDEVGIFHDGQLVARLDGADVFTSSTTFSFTDWWAQIGQSVTISVVAVVNGEFADDSPTATVTPNGRGIWLVDPATNVAAVLWGMESATDDGSDMATEYRTVDGAFVRRRLANAAKSGAHSGQIIDVNDLDAQDTLDAFATFRANDAGTVYRLIRGRENRAVIAGNLLDTPTPSDGRHGKAIAVGQFSWWDALASVVVDGG